MSPSAVYPKGTDIAAPTATTVRHFALIVASTVPPAAGCADNIVYIHTLYIRIIIAKIVHIRL